MSRYYLSEAYASIYNPRLQEDFDDNLRFIDYMLDEDIEEVVESLFWEFRDYGHSIDESIELLRIAAEPEVIMEAYDTIVEQMLYEEMTPRQEYEARQKKEARARKLGSDLRNPTASNYINRKGGVSVVAKDITNRLGNRASRIAAAVKTGVINKVKAAWSGAKGGMGKAKAAVSGGVSKAGEFVSQQRQAAKAKLQKLMRTGSAKVERAKRNLTGETGRTLKTRQRMLARNRGNVEARRDPWEINAKARPAPREGNAEARRDPWEGNAQPRRAPKVGSHSTDPKKSEPTVRALLPAAKSETLNDTKQSSPVSRRHSASPKKNIEPDPWEGETRRTSSKSENVEKAKKALKNRAVDRAMATSTKLLPGSTEPTSKSKFSKASKTKTNKQNAALSRRLGGTTGKLYQTPQEKKVMLRASYEAMIDNIIEDLIYEGYAYDEYDALEIINNLNEDTLYDITQEYLAE